MVRWDPGHSPIWKKSGLTIAPLVALWEGRGGPLGSRPLAHLEGEVRPHNSASGGPLRRQRWPVGIQATGPFGRSHASPADSTSEIGSHVLGGCVDGFISQPLLILSWIRSRIPCYVKTGLDSWSDVQGAYSSNSHQANLAITLLRACSETEGLVCVIPNSQNCFDGFFCGIAPQLILSNLWRMKSTR
jgi:hypothetical protein